VGYFKYKLAFALLGFTSVLTLILTLLQMVYDRTRPAAAGEYDNIEEEWEGEDKQGNKSKRVKTEPRVGDGDMEMSKYVNNEEKEIVTTDEGLGASKEKEAPVLHPPLALKLLISSFFFVYVGIEIGYGGKTISGHFEKSRALFSIVYYSIV
jgi:hypothetical protein